MLYIMKAEPVITIPCQPTKHIIDFLFGHLDNSAPFELVERISNN